jgi:uncharacterized OsmC-like protein
VRSSGNFQQEIVAANHTWFADEPLDVGGDDTGPDPYSLLLGSLGACTSMTLLMYARRKQWPLEHVEIHLTHRRDYLKDCETCSDKPVQIDRIERTIHLTGPLDEAQRARLVEIAKMCPVHRTLSGTIQIEDNLMADLAPAD